MTQVLSWVFGAGYWLVCLSVLLRATLMLVAYVRSTPEGRKKSGAALGLSALAECSWCALVGITFRVSHVDLIPLVLAMMGLATIRRVALFNRVGSQHVYSLLAAAMPKRQASLARLTALRLF